jgi:hypothetical protein
MKCRRAKANGVPRLSIRVSRDRVDEEQEEKFEQLSLKEVVNSLDKRQIFTARRA